jgi:hypothetical protein
VARASVFSTAGPSAPRRLGWPRRPATRRRQRRAEPRAQPGRRDGARHLRAATAPRPAVVTSCPTAPRRPPPRPQAHLGLGLGHVDVLHPRRRARHGTAVERCCPSTEGGSEVSRGFHCMSLQRVATHCTALQRIPLHCNALPCIAVHSLQEGRPTTQCNELSALLSNGAILLTSAGRAEALGLERWPTLRSWARYKPAPTTAAVSAYPPAG